MDDRIVNGEIFHKAYVSKPSHIGGYWKDGLPVEFTQEQVDLIGMQSENQQEDYAKSLMPQPIDPQLPNQSTSSF